jgi:uncharacterized protein YndB with AHSA1/START domain
VSTTRIVQHIDAPRAAVYRAILDPTAVQAWQVPRGMTSQVHVFEAREGGAFRISLTYEDPAAAGKSGAHTDTFHGTFVRLVPDAEIVQTTEFETDDAKLAGTMTITYRLRDAAGGGTELEGVHEGVPAGVKPEDNELGWRMSLGQLAQLVERGGR